MKSLYLLIASIFLISCSTDLNVLADYKETAIVHGLLSQSDTAQYIKINKAFIGPGNALEIAQVYDSVNYQNQLTVKLEQWKNGGKVSTITLTKDSSIAKPAGIFSSPKQMLYKTKATLDETSKYNLVITNNATHNVITGSTLLVNDFLVTKPFSTSLNFVSTTNKFKIEWTSSLNGKVYGVTLRFYYLEEDRSTGVVTKKFIDWIFGNQTTLSTKGGESMFIDFFGETFYQYLQNRLPVNNNVKRYVPNTGAYVHVDLIFTVGAEDLSTYIAVSAPSTGIIQERPQYTNLNNGFGLFSSRYTKIKTGYQLTSASVVELYSGQFTKNLFCDPIPGGPNSCN